MGRGIRSDHWSKVGFFLLVVWVGKVDARSITVLSEKHQVYTPATPDPSLISYELTEAKEKVMLDNDENLADYITSMRVILKTQNTAQIEDYAIVQFIRGCLFESSWNGKAVAKSGGGLVYDLFGKTVPFKLRRWVIDSDNIDPVFSSYAGFGRFALWRWNADPTSYETGTATYYAKRHPPHPVVFGSDFPSPAAVNENIVSAPATGHLPPVKSATNASFEFNTCLFRSRDVPLQSTPEGAGLRRSAAIHCFAWEHKFVYNYQQNKFVQGGRIDPYCLAK
jgi:hypothetical protein